MRNAIIMVAFFTVIMTGCEDGNSLDRAGQIMVELEDTIPTQPTTPTDTTHTPTTDPTAWTTVYGGDATMDNDGFVRRYLLIARQDGKSDSVVSNYNVVMTLKDTTRIEFKGTELDLLGSNQSLYPTGDEKFTEGQDHVWRASEHTAREVYLGATVINVSIEREIAKVIIKGKEQAFEFARYEFDATKEAFRVVIDTVENKIYRYDILDGKAHMKQGLGDYAKPFVVIMTRFVGEVETTPTPDPDPETPDTPTPETPKENPMPGCLIVDGKPVFYGTITPVVANGGKLQGYDNIILAQTNDSLYAVHAASAKVVVKGSRSTYPLSSNTVTASYTAVQVNGVWKIAFVERNQTGSAYVYRWGNGTTESYTVPVAEFVTGGAKNLDEKGNAKQNPFLRVVTSQPNSYDNGYTYQVQAYNYTKQVANLVIGYFK